MIRGYPPIAALGIYLLLLVMQVVSYRHLCGEFTGEPGVEGYEEHLGELRIRTDREEHVGYIAGSVLGVIGMIGVLVMRRGHAFEALVFAMFPTAIAGASWICWALVNFKRSDYLDASPPAGIIGLNGILSGIVCPIVCGCILAKDRPEESAIPENVQGAIGAFAGAVCLWTVLFVFSMIKYMGAV